MKKIATMSIGDIHGRNDWMYFTHGSPEEFETWKGIVANGGPVEEGFNPEIYQFINVDKVIFVGDYVDSFTIKNLDMKKNLEDIIFFKKALPDKVVLLLGNHDVQYIVSDQICSGYRPEMKYDFYDIFIKNIDLFQLSYRIENYLWTHAGVTNEWFKEFEAELFNPKNRFYEITKYYTNATIDEKLNLGWEVKALSIYNVDHISGGFQMWAGPLWVRPHVLNKHAIDGYFQIVGHTPQSAIWETDDVAYIDCLEYGDHGDVYNLEIDLN